MLNTGAYCTVVLSSDGGNTIAGLKLGRLFREHQMTTKVKPGKACSSICASAFLGGTTRILPVGSSLFFHAPYNMEITSLRCNAKDSYVVTELERYTIEMLGNARGTTVHLRSMRYCSWYEGWVIGTRPLARRYGITT